MTGLDVASLAGTWVAAGLALVALVAVVGPILVWRASRTERHKAKARLGGKSNGYLTRGVPVWPGIRLWQSLRTPNTKAARMFQDEEWAAFDMTKIKSLPESPVTWVQFGTCLQAYGVKLRYSSDAVLNGDGFALQIRPSYLFNFLVLGRYQKKQPRSTQPPLLENRSPSVLLTMAQTNSADANPSDGWTLYGLTGILTFEHGYTRGSRVTGVVRFTDSLDHCQRNIVPDRLPRMSLLLLMLGFLPLPSGEHICCTVGAYDLPATTEEKNGVNFADSDDDSDDMLPREYHVPRELSGETRATRAERRTKKMIMSLKVEAYGLQKMALAPGNTPLGSEYGTQTVSALRSVDDSAALQPKLQELATMTYIPPSEQYVRMSLGEVKPVRASLGRYMPENAEEWNIAFMTRESAQLFALALLTMPWSVNNYVMTKGDGRNIAVTMLADAAASSVRLVSRLKKNVSSLHLQLPHSTRFLAACDGILRSLETANLCELDDTLAALQHATVEIPLMVGVLVLTSHEYRELIYQSVRHVTST